MKKTDIPGLYKVADGILINKDNEALRAYKMKKNRDKRLDEVCADVDGMKNDISEIKQLLKILVEK